MAIEVGFRHIDGAFVYGTEEEVGRAIHEKIADGTVKREDIFYTGKVGGFCFNTDIFTLLLPVLIFFLIYEEWCNLLKASIERIPWGEGGVLFTDLGNCFL